MSRLLFIHCPINPKVFNPVGGNDLEFSGPAERFRWSLVEQSPGSKEPRIDSQGVGTISSLPFADEALVLIPTVDVRLVHTRVPLIAGRKLEALLPTLAEPYLLDQRSALRYQLLPPGIGTNPTERTIAVISESWMQWLESQLAGLPVRRISMIPDCLLLDNPASSENATTPSACLVDTIDHFNIIANRHGSDWGSGWVEYQDNPFRASSGAHNEPKRISFNWDWILPRACQWLEARNGLTLTLQKPAPAKQRQNRTAVRWQPKVRWALWRQPARYAAIAFAVYLTGSAVYLCTLLISHWRWDKAIDEVARQNISTPIAPTAQAVPSYVRQASERIHSLGGQTAGDFIPMASKLQNLLTAYTSGLLESVTYQSDGIRFRLKNTKTTPKPSQIEERARQLEIAIISLGRNEYQLLPYAGLLGNKATGDNP